MKPEFTDFCGILLPSVSPDKKYYMEVYTWEPREEKMLKNPRNRCQKRKVNNRNLKGNDLTYKKLRCGCLWAGSTLKKVLAHQTRATPNRGIVIETYPHIVSIAPV